MAGASWSASGDQVHLHEAAPTAGPRDWHLLLHRAPGRGVVTFPVTIFYDISTNQLDLTGAVIISDKAE